MRNLEYVVNDYIRQWRPVAKAERLSFAKEPTLEAAISRAALCELSSGKRHPHQYRIPRSSLTAARDRLLLNRKQLRRCRSFAELHSLVDALIRDIWMVGELVVYDVSTNIGAFLHREPKHVYLHRGTREGARALGFSGSMARLSPDQLPKQFDALSPDEIEDCLCIYKRQLRGETFYQRTGCVRVKPRSVATRVKGRVC